MDDDCSNKITKREHLITSADIHRIKRDFGLQPGRLSEDEMESVDLNIKKNVEAVVFYHPYSKNEPYFTVGVQTPAQKTLLQKFGSNIVCMDATHGTNRRKLLLITVLVLDDMRRGLPVAWYLTSREDEKSLIIFLSALKERCGPIQATVFMSDDADQYFNAWSKVFPSSHTKKLICRCHVLQSWQQNVQSKAKTIGARKIVFDILKRLIRIPDAEQFSRAKELFLEVLAKFSNKFKAYFEENYCVDKRLPQWTTFSRKKVGINTNMHIERFHRTLKYNFFNKHENHRLDFLIFTLLEVYMKNYQIRNNSISAIGNISDIQRRNNRSQEIDLSDVQVIEDYRQVKSMQSRSKSNVYYIVKKTKSDCSCKFKCRACLVCCDMYTCTCYDFLVANYACKHIHIGFIRWKWAS